MDDTTLELIAALAVAAAGVAAALGFGFRALGKARPAPQLVCPGCSAVLAIGLATRPCPKCSVACHIPCLALHIVTHAALDAVRFTAPPRLAKSTRGAQT